MKYFLAFEVSFAFTPIILLWVWGLYGVPGFIRDTMQGQGTYMQILFAMLLGLFGVAGIVMTSIALIQGRKSARFNIVSAIFVVLGIAGLLLGLPNGFNIDITSLLFFWAPLVVGVHLLFLTVKQLTSASAGFGA